MPEDPAGAGRRLTAFMNLFPPPAEPVGSLAVSSRSIVLSDRVVAGTGVVEDGRIVAIEE